MGAASEMRALAVIRSRERTNWFVSKTINRPLLSHLRELVVVKDYKVSIYEYMQLSLTQ